MLSKRLQPSGMCWALLNCLGSAQALGRRENVGAEWAQYSRSKQVIRASRAEQLPPIEEGLSREGHPVRRPGLPGHGAVAVHAQEAEPRRPHHLAETPRKNLTLPRLCFFTASAFDRGNQSCSSFFPFSSSDGSTWNSTVRGSRQEQAL